MPVPKIIQDIRNLIRKNAAQDAEILDRVRSSDFDTAMESLSEEDGRLHSADLDILTSISTINNNINDLNNYMGNMLIETAASTLTLGEEFFIEELGVLTPYIAVHRNYLSSSNLIGLRKNVLANQVHFGSEGYYVSELHIAFTNQYSSRVESVSKVAIDLPVISNATPLNTSIFIPSLTELTGRTVENYNEGVQFDYFKNISSDYRSYLIDTAVSYHLRSSNQGMCYYIDPTGRAINGYVYNSRALRPCISLDNSAVIFKRGRPLSTINVFADATLE